MTDQFGDDVGGVLDRITSNEGLRVLSTYTPDSYLFRGPHGRVESFTDKTDKEAVGHWTRGAYVQQDALVLELEKAANENPFYTGTERITRDVLGDVEPLVIEISEPCRCTLCHERFPSGNAFGWHLADVHEIDTDDKTEYSTTVPDGQHTLGGFSGGEARAE